MMKLASVEAEAATVVAAAGTVLLHSPPISAAVDAPPTATPPMDANALAAIVVEQVQEQAAANLAVNKQCRR